MLKAVIFDMDGVLVDSEPLHRKAEQQVFSELGFSPEDLNMSNLVGKSRRLMWSELKEKFQLQESVEALMEYDNDVRVQIMKNANNPEPIPGIPELLEELEEKQIQMALASSSSPEVIQTLVNKINLNSFFTIQISGDRVKRGKPFPDIFLEALNKLHVLPQNCVVIEDSENGIKASKAAKIACIGFNNPNTEKQDLSMADLVIHDLTKLDYKVLFSLVNH